MLPPSPTQLYHVLIRLQRKVSFVASVTIFLSKKNPYTYFLTMYILASDFFEIDDKDIFKAKNSCCVQEIFTFKYVFIFFFRNKSDDFLYLYIRNFENSCFKPVFVTYTYSFVFVLISKQRILSKYCFVEKWC